MKTLKFANHLIPLVLSGEKNSTWRLFDDKDLQEGDELIFTDNIDNRFGTAVILSTREKKLEDLEDADYEGHGKFESQERMYETYKGYYGDKVKPDSVVKIIKFKFKND